MDKHYMKTSTLISLIVISSLFFLLKADSMATTNTTSDPAPFQLMDLTQLLKSLNVTYQDLAINLSTLDTLNNLPSPSQLDQNQTTTTTPQSNPITTKPTTDAVIPSQTPAQDSKPASTPKAASSASNNSSPTPQKIVDTSYTTKPSTTSSQNTKPTKNIQPAPTTSNQSSPSPAVSASTSSSNSPTFGPGPNNKSLPPVIDLTKMTVDYVAPASKPSTSSLTSNPTTTSTTTQTSKQSQLVSDNTASTKSPPTSAVKITSNNVVNSQNTNSQTQISNIQSNPSVSPPSTVATKTQTTTMPTQINIQPSSSTSNILPVIQQTDNNSIYLAPISTPTKPIPDSSKSNYQNQQTNQPQTPPSVLSIPSSSPSAYQCWNSDDAAIYNITTTYKSFSPYFIITKNDPYLLSLRTYLLNNYGNYLSQGQIIAGFRVYNNYGDNSLDYQLLYSTFYGTFTSILTYWPDTSRIMLKTLSILNFFIMEIDYSNCQTQDLVQQNCKVCNDGYRNFMGRCRALDPFCRKYLTDQCGACIDGKRLLNGQCQ